MSTVPPSVQLDLASLVEALTAAPANLCEVIERIWPFPHGDSEITERNLGSNLMLALQARGWCVYVEIPLADLPTVKDPSTPAYYRQHLDLLALRGDTLVLMEAKCISSLPALKSLGVDFERLMTHAIPGIIDPYFVARGRPAPTNLIELVLFSTWSDDLANWWSSAPVEEFGRETWRAALADHRMHQLTRQSFVARSQEGSRWPRWWWCYGYRVVDVAQWRRESQGRHGDGTGLGSVATAPA